MLSPEVPRGWGGLPWLEGGDPEDGGGTCRPLVAPHLPTSLGHDHSPLPYTGKAWSRCQLVSLFVPSLESHVLAHL